MIYNYNVPSETVKKLGFCQNIELGPRTYLKGSFDLGATRRLFYYDNDKETFQVLVMADTVCAYDPETEGPCINFEIIGDKTVCLITFYQNQHIYILEENNDFLGLRVVNRTQSVMICGSTIDGGSDNFYSSARNAFTIKFDQGTRKYTLTPTEKGQICTSLNAISPEPPETLPDNILE